MNGQRDEGQEVVETTQSLQVGDVLDVTVQDQPAAGYRWETATLPAGLTRLADTAPGETVGGRGAGAGAVGGSVARVLHLRAERPGSFEVVLQLVRTWETGTVPPAQERRLTVVVAGHPSDDTGSPGGRGTSAAG
ncbi:MAG: protease inhibitor I42 family protein [Sporichthyaceae bacterium]